MLCVQHETEAKLLPDVAERATNQFERKPNKKWQLTSHAKKRQEELSRKIETDDRNEWK